MTTTVILLLITMTISNEKYDEARENEAKDKLHGKKKSKNRSINYEMRKKDKFG